MRSVTFFNFLLEATLVGSVLIALMLIVILVRRIVGRYELKQEYRRQVHRARKLRSA